MKSSSSCCVVVVALLAFGRVAAAEAGREKTGYSLARPTPDALLREMSTDRPDQTESPFTVDAGRLQVEMDLITYTRDHDTRGGDVVTAAWSYAPVNLKLGLRHDLDLQCVIETYTRLRTEDRAARTITRQGGFGDVTLRLKKNFWGNDGGPTAFAAMPFVKLPTNRDGLGNTAVEGGLILPFAIELPQGWSLGMMTEVDVRRSESRSGRHAAFINTITVGHDIAGPLGFYVELASEVKAKGGGRWVGMADLGLTYGVTKNLQLDAGVNVGVTKSADDVNVFTGVSRRF